MEQIGREKEMHESFSDGVEKMVEKDIGDESRRHSEFSDNIKNVSLNVSDFFKKNENNLNNAHSSLKECTKISERTYTETNEFISNQASDVNRLANMS